MKNLKWLTISSWIDETIEVISKLETFEDISKIPNWIQDGSVLESKKISSAERMYSAIKARFLTCAESKVNALIHLLKSNISKDTKISYLFIYFLEEETLAQFYLEGYVYENYLEGQSIYTKRDIEYFFNLLKSEYKNYIPKEELTESSEAKVKNQLWKFLEDFGWGEKKDEKFYLRKPTLSPEWLVFILYFYFDEMTISLDSLYNKDIFKRFLISRDELMYLLLQAKQKKYIQMEEMGNIRRLIKVSGGDILEYARSITNS